MSARRGYVRGETADGLARRLAQMIDIAETAKSSVRDREKIHAAKIRLKNYQIRRALNGKNT